MKLRNKKTGETRNLSVDMDRPDDGIRVYADDGVSYRMYNSLAELNEEWEDYEEPKECWYVDTYGKVWKKDSLTLKDGFDFEPLIKFETKEEAEKAVEKLKAWKRLKEKGFKFRGWIIDDGIVSIFTNIGCKDIYDDNSEEIEKLLDLLFGREE